LSQSSWAPSSNRTGATSSLLRRDVVEACHIDAIEGPAHGWLISADERIDAAPLAEGVVDGRLAETIVGQLVSAPEEPESLRRDV
jgi:hypothetical protein